MTKNHSRLMAIVAAVCAVGLSACGSSKSSTPTTTPTTAAAVTSAAAPTDTATASGSAAAAAQSMTATPSTGLKTGDKVAITAKGFPPNDNLGINLCADEGAATGAGDCDLRNLVGVKSDAQGNVKGTYVVHKGPFGQNQRTCGGSTKCVLSVAELSPTGVNTSTPVTFS